MGEECLLGLLDGPNGLEFVINIGLGGLKMYQSPITLYQMTPLYSDF